MSDNIKKSSSTSGAIKVIIGLALLAYGLMGFVDFLFPSLGFSESKARDSVELSAQNYVLNYSGVIPYTESEVVYKNSDYAVIAVKSAFDKNLMEDGLYEGRFTKYSIRSEMILSSTDFLPTGYGDFFNPNDQQLAELKVIFQLE